MKIVPYKHELLYVKFTIPNGFNAVYWVNKDKESEHYYVAWGKRDFERTTSTFSRDEITDAFNDGRWVKI